MKKATSVRQLCLRIALGIGFITPGLDRLGVWGKYGQRGISWGDWQHFMVYAADVMQFLPGPLITALAITATVCELLFGALLLVGLFTRVAAIGSGMLTFCFAVSMAISHGVVEPLSYSVFTVSAASFLLAGVEKYRWSLDLWRMNQKMIGVKREQINIQIL